MRRFDEAVSGMALPVGILVAAFTMIALTVGDASLPFGHDGRSVVSGSGLSGSGLLGGEAGTWRMAISR